VFGRAKIKESPAGDDRWLDGGCVQQAKVTQQKLRRVLEAVGCEPCFGENVTFDVGGHGFGIAFRFVGFSAAIQIVRPKAFQSHVWPPGIVPAFEFRAQERQRVKPFDGVLSVRLKNLNL
jgi:hypothetical protein